MLSPIQYLIDIKLMASAMGMAATVFFKADGRAFHGDRGNEIKTTACEYQFYQRKDSVMAAWYVFVFAGIDRG